MTSSGAKPPKPKSFNASKDDDWLGVHMITEFIFCPRAGLIAYQKRETEDERDPEPQDTPQEPLLTYKTFYNLRKLEVWLNRTFRRFWIYLGVCAGLLVAASVLSILQNNKVWFYGGVGIILIFFFKGMVPLIRQMLRLQNLRSQEQRAPIVNPIPGQLDGQSVNWWSLLKSGFALIPYNDMIRDYQWRIQGEPWKVLSYGSYRIPVWRWKRYSPGEKLSRQHFARMGAYFRLLEKSEGCKSPYGVVLKGDSYEGIYVENNRGCDQALRRGLDVARETVKAYQQGIDPSAPNPSNPCHGCPLGKPYFNYRLDYSKKGIANIPPYWVYSYKGSAYRSACGDRFRWIPPHQRAKELHLHQG